LIESGSCRRVRSHFNGMSNEFGSSPPGSPALTFSDINGHQTVGTDGGINGDAVSAVAGGLAAPGGGFTCSSQNARYCSRTAKTTGFFCSTSSSGDLPSTDHLVLLDASLQKRQAATM